MQVQDQPKSKKLNDKEKLDEEEEEKDEDSDSSELPDDYDPDAVAKAPALEAKQSSIRLQKKKTVMFPLKMTAKEKK